MIYQVCTDAGNAAVSTSSLMGRQLSLVRSCQGNWYTAPFIENTCVSPSGTGNIVRGDAGYFDKFNHMGGDMTLCEVRKLLEMREDERYQYLKAELMLKEEKLGIIQQKVRIYNGDDVMIKAFRLSEHLCVHGDGHDDFKDFRGFLSMTHMPTGYRVASGIRGSKHSLITLAKSLEEVCSLNFKNPQCADLRPHLFKLRGIINDYMR